MWRPAFHRTVLATVAILVPLTGGTLAAIVEREEAVQLGRQYLASHDSRERRQLAVQLAGYEGDIEAVLNRLSAQTHQRVNPGYHPREHFSVRELRKKHPDELLCFDVPENYRLDTPTGLIVNGQQQFSDRVKPSLATALESYLRRNDWGLIYPIKVELTIGR